MGCTQSKVEHEETVTRCKERKLFMKDAVSSRNAFTAAHTLYAMSLKNTGAALTDYAHGEVHFHHHSPPSSAALPSVAAYDTSLPPPPPPLPSFQPSLPPLQRASTMPADISLHKRDLHSPADPIFEEEEEEEDDDIDAETGHSLKHRTSRSSGGGRARDVEDEGLPPPPPTPPTPPTPPVSDRDRAPPPPPPQGMSSWDFFFSSMENFPGRTLTDVDEDRIHKEELERKMNEDRSKAAEVVDSGGGGGGKSSDKAETAKMAKKAAAEPPPEPPPATKVLKKMNHVTSLNGNQGGKGEPNVNLLWIFSELDNCFLEASESAHDVSMMLEANRLHYHSNFADNRGHINHSERVMRAITWNRSFKGLPNADDGIDDLDSEEHETHATVLDKMLAWEKKLYDEVKAGEEMKLEYQRKVASLNKLKKRGARTESIEKAKAAVSHLHTRYIVDMQSMDSTVLEINRLRDEQLYPKLVALVDGMATMWATMRRCHEKQSKIVIALKYLNISESPKETSDHHHDRTDQLWGIARQWHSYFEDLMTHQKGYIRALKSWLNLNLIPIDNNLKEKVSSPQRPQNPPIQALLETWNGFLDSLPNDLTRTAITNFAAIMHTVVECQAEEIKLRNRREESRKDLERRIQQFNDWHSKYLQRRTPPEETDPDRPLERDVVAEKQFTVELAKKKLEDDEEAYERQCIHVREKSLTSLKTGLPELFRGLLEFSDVCSDMYSKLRYLTAS